MKKIDMYDVSNELATYSIQLNDISELILFNLNKSDISKSGQLPQSKDVGLVTHDLTVSGNNATSLLPHYTWLHHWVVDSPHLTNTFTH